VSVPQPDRAELKAPNDDAPAPERANTPQAPATPHQPSVPRTRMSAAWIGICATALVSVALIVFLLQNTRKIEVNFLWLHGTLPLALALLVAAVGSAILTMVFGTARITQLRRLARQRRD
jgi:lipopolysaccharide assembly protein A